MPFKTEPRMFKSWSNSRWNDYAQCPARANYKHLLKLPEPKSPQMDRGIFIAKQEEDYFLGKIDQIPPDVKVGLHPHFKKARARKTKMVEQNWGFDKDWNVVDYFDWDNCWLRVKVDVGWTEKAGLHIALRDNKTGAVDKKTGGLNMRDNEKYMEQLDLYGAAAIARFPKATTVSSALWYTDLGVEFPIEGPQVITAEQARASQKVWSKKVIPMFNDKRFLPRPGFYCQWCHFRKGNGGPCKF